MIVYTQINEPNNLKEGEIWLPCLETSPTKHRQSWKQPLSLTHIDAIKHYDYDIVPLLDQVVHCIGPKTYDRLKDMGFTQVHLHGLVAEDIKINQMPITPCTWLHGDRYSKDFSTYNGVTAIKTFTTSLCEGALSKIKEMVTTGKPPSKIFVYSDLVCQALQEFGDWPQTELGLTESCEADSSKWLKTQAFYPGEE